MNDFQDISNADYSTLNNYSKSVPIPKEWLYQYSLTSQMSDFPKGKLTHKDPLPYSNLNKFDYKDTSIMYDHGFNLNYKNPYSQNSYGEFNVYTSQPPVKHTNGIPYSDIKSYPNVYKKYPCNSAYPSTEMVFRNPSELDETGNDPNKVQVYQQINLLQKQYNGNQQNIRLPVYNGKPAIPNISPNPYTVPFKRSEFAKDHSTMVSH